MLGKVACRAFHVVSRAGKVWLHSLPSYKWSEQLFYLNHGLKFQVHYGKRAHQGETRPHATCSREVTRLAWRSLQWAGQKSCCCWQPFECCRFPGCS